MKDLNHYSLHGSKMIQQRYEFDPSKRYIFLRLPLDATLHCTIETHDGSKLISKSAEFPCRCVRTSLENFSLTIAGVDNSNTLQSDNLGRNSFRFTYRLDDQIENGNIEYVFVPLNNHIKFSFAFGSEENFSIGKGGNDVRFLYQFDETRKILTTTWIESPWRISWSVPALKNKFNKLIGDSKAFLMLE